MAVRSASMDALRRNALAVWPGMVIGWIGDLAHQATVSGHNPDDTPGVRAELADADSLAEVRALDFMLGPHFDEMDAWLLVDALLEARSRLYYVIWGQSIWHRSNGWVRHNYDGTAHDNHVHVSGWAEDDANGANWPTVLEIKLGGFVEPADVWNKVSFGKNDKRRTTGAILTETRSAVARVERWASELEVPQFAISQDMVNEAVKVALSDPDVIKPIALAVIAELKSAL